MVVTSVSVILYKTMGLPNRLIGLTSALALPWVIKMLWAPCVDACSTKRRWIVATQALLACGLAAAAVSLHLQPFFAVSMAIFALIAFTSATHDIATDGFYILSLPAEQQALFSGVRSTCYRLAMIFSSGILVMLAGVMEQRTHDTASSWTAALALAAVIMLALSLFHNRCLPRPVADSPARQGFSAGGTVSAAPPFLAAFRSYFTQPQVTAVVAFILLYRLGEAMLVKMAQPFLLDNAARGGLQISMAAVGFAYGTMGTICLLAGGILGGWLIARFGFRRCVWPMAIALNAPDLVYVYLAVAKPSLAAVYALVALEQFGYGIGFSAFTIFLMYRAREPFKTSHYAISTGLMALGLMLPGFISGYLQEYLGYARFFILVCFLTIPGMFTIIWIPRDES
ncbi:MAG: MFS transporter [Candidatus Aureabacteria bacterium]|nr:MFS transporter [Candidatus Auribacterota bacterium]